MKKSIYLIAVVAIFMSACNGTSKQSQQEEGQTEMSKVEAGDQASPEMTKQSTRAAMIIDGYLALKNALTQDNSELAASAGQLIVDAFAKFDNSEWSGDQLNEINDIVENANEQAVHIARNSDNMEHQREHFEVISTDITDLIAIVGTDRTLYQDFCPMYKKKGGYWLSASKEIKNPYFGSKMLGCGKITKEISSM